MTVIITKYTQIFETQLIHRSSNAAVAGLVRWVLELTGSDIHLTTLQESSSQSQITISCILNEDKGPWVVTVRLISVNGGSSLYWCRLKYPTGNAIAYFVYVNSAGQFSFDVSVLFESTSILATYRTELEQVKQSNIMKIKLITLIDGSSQIKEIEHITKNTRTTQSQNQLSPSKTNTTLLSQILFSNKSTTEKIDRVYNYDIYQQPEN